MNVIDKGRGGGNGGVRRCNSVAVRRKGGPGFGRRDNNNNNTQLHPRGYCVVSDFSIAIFFFARGQLRSLVYTMITTWYVIWIQGGGEGEDRGQR